MQGDLPDPLGGAQSGPPNPLGGGQGGLLDPFGGVQASIQGTQNGLQQMGASGGAQFSDPSARQNVSSVAPEQQQNDTVDLGRLTVMLEQQQRAFTNLLNQILDDQEEKFSAQLERNNAEQRRQLNTLRSNFFSALNQDGGPAKVLHCQEGGPKVNQSFVHSKLGHTNVFGKQNDFAEQTNKQSFTGPHDGGAEDGAGHDGRQYGSAKDDAGHNGRHGGGPRDGAGHSGDQDGGADGSTGLGGDHDGGAKDGTGRGGGHSGGDDGDDGNGEDHNSNNKQNTNTGPDFDKIFARLGDVLAANLHPHHTSSAQRRLPSISLPEFILGGDNKPVMCSYFTWKSKVLQLFVDNHISDNAGLSLLQSCESLPNKWRKSTQHCTSVGGFFSLCDTLTPPLQSLLPQLTDSLCRVKAAYNNHDMLNLCDSICTRLADIIAHFPDFDLTQQQLTAVLSAFQSGNSLELLPERVASFVKIKEEKGVALKVQLFDFSMSRRDNLHNVIASIPVSYTHLTLPTKRIV